MKPPPHVHRLTAFLSLALLLEPGSGHAAPLHPRINEVVTANISGPPDEYEADLSNCPVANCGQWYEDLGESEFDGDYPDWIEIHNPSAASINLSGHGLSDDPDAPFKWTFPDVEIPAGGHLMVFASGKNKVETFIHTNFKLSRRDESVFLTSPSGELLDSIFVGGIPVDFSLGRRLDAPESWVWFDRPTPGAENGQDPFPGFKGSLSIDPAAGFHPSNIDVAITSADDVGEIRYTLDGSPPSADSAIYTEPLPVTETTVLRAQGFLDGHTTTGIETRTYLIGESFTFPVVSLSTDPDNLWDPDLGMYTAGRNARESQRIANYWNDWERPVRVEFFEPDGRRGFELDAGLQIFGWGSRANPQKSLAIMMRNRYGANGVDHPLFPGSRVGEFRSFVLRAAGSDSISRGTFFRDPFATGLLEKRDLDVQAFRPAIVYINGEYFGIQNIREKMNEDFLAAHHGVDPDNVDIISRYWRRTYPVVIEGDAEAYLEFESALERFDTAGRLERVIADRIDLEHFLTYIAAQIWFANYDWPGNNNKVWRSREPGSLWRVFMYDLDYTMSFQPGQNPATHDTLSHALTPNGNGWPNPSWTTLLNRKILDVPSFQEAFINRMADLMNEEFSVENTEARLDAMEALLAPEMPRHIQRWAGTGDAIGSMSAWRNNIATVRTFLRARSANVRNHLRSYFGLTNAKIITVGTAPAEGGSLKLNSLLITNQSWEGSYFPSVPITLHAQPAPGHRFTHWEGLPAGVDASAPRISVDPADVSEITAVFEPDSGAMNSVIIHEIAYHPADDDTAGEWIELLNTHEQPIDVSGWQLARANGGAAIRIRDDTILDPGAFLVLCGNLTDFATRFPDVTNVQGNLPFDLRNSGDIIQLFNSWNELVDEVAFDDATPWPPEADGNGPTLALINPAADNSLAENWAASEHASGSPGRPNQAELIPPLLNADFADDTLSLSFEPAASHTYVIQRSGDLSGWMNERAIVGAGEERNVEVSLNNGTGSGFYRVQRIQP